MFTETLTFTVARDSLGDATPDEIDAFCQSLAVSLAVSFPNADPVVAVGQSREIGGSAIRTDADHEHARDLASRCWDRMAETMAHYHA